MTRSSEQTAEFDAAEHAGVQPLAQTGADLLRGAVANRRVVGPVGFVALKCPTNQRRQP